MPHEDIKMRFDKGLDALNIAPEFGQIETMCYLESDIDFDKFYDICYTSGRWRKWVSNDFVPHIHKRELVKICGHYVLSQPEFLEIKPDIDDVIKQTIKAVFLGIVKTMKMNLSSLHHLHGNKKKFWPKSLIH